MKKVLFVILAVMIVCVAAGYLYADINYTRDPRQTILTEVFSSASGGEVSSTITAGMNIIGFTCYDSSAGSCGLYDTTTTTLIKAGTGVFAESSVAAGTSTTVILPLPYKITSGFGVLAASTGRVIVYYEK